MPGFSEQLLIEPHYGVIVHRNFETLYSDDNYARFYGYKSAQDILSLTSILELISPADHPQALQTYQDLMSGKQKPGVRTYKNIDKDNNELTVLAIDNIIDWEGLPAMQVIIIDFSYQLETQRNLMLSEERYRVLVDGSIQGILVHNNFKPLFCNNAYAQMFGFENEKELLGTDSILTLIPSEHHDQAYRDNRSLLAGDESVIKTEGKGIRVDGSIVWVSLLSRTVIWDGAPATQITVMDITEQQLLRERLEHRANYDVLTSLLTRRAFNELLEKEFTFAKENLTSLCCVLIDIDDFKSINDQNGHHSGDKVLQSFATVAKKNLRESDFIGRWGGDEFVLVLPKTDLKNGRSIAERLCNDLAKLSVRVDNINLHFTVSIGVSSLSKKAHNVSTLLSEADKALYQAKHQGKGRVVIATQ